MENITLIRDFNYKSSTNLNQDSINSLNKESSNSFSQNEIKDNKELLINRMIIKELRLKLSQSEEMLKE